MKSKAQKQAEAIERNEQYRSRYLDQAKKLGLDEYDAKQFADRKIGIPKTRRQGD